MAIFSIFALIFKAFCESQDYGGRFCWVVLGLLLFVLCPVPLVATSAQAADCGGCALLDWPVIALLDEGDRMVITRRIRQRCADAIGWIKRQDREVTAQARRQLCQDLVLLWTYQECKYQREYIDRRVYQPCLAWAREMHRRCLADDRVWFSVPAEPVR